MRLIHAGKWIMLGIVSLSLFIEMQQREINNPTERHLVRVNQLKTLSQFHTQAEEDIVADFGAISHKEQQVAWVSLHPPNNRLHLVGGHKLRQGRFYVTGRTDCQRDKALRAQRPCKLCQFLNLFATIPCRSWHANAFYHAIIRQRTLKHAKISRACQLRNLRERQVKAQVWMVSPEAIHNILIAQAREGAMFNVLVRRLLNQEDEQALDKRHHIIFGDKRHLQVKLRKFWLAVRALVFIAETTRYLEIAVKTCYHQ